MLSSRATRQARIFPSQPREPKPPGTRTPSTPEELGAGLVDGHVLGIDPADVHVAAGRDTRVLESLVHREICVVQLDVLADERDLDRLAPVVDALGELEPVTEVGRRSVEPELAAHELVEPLAVQVERHEVDVADVGVRDDRVDVDIGEERDLLADLTLQRLRRAAHEHVGVDPDAPELVDRVLGRLGLELARGVDERHERDVQVDHVLGPCLAPELPDRLEERQRLDVADRAADLGDHDIGVRRLGDRADSGLDLVGDVRDDLHRRPEVLALALLAQHAVPDGTGRVVRGAREVLVDEPLVVADVEVGLGAVLGDEHLTVLERAHRPGIDVDVRVELLDLHLQPARLQQSAERCRGDALAERRNDAAGDEDELRAHAQPPVIKLTEFDRSSPPESPIPNAMLGSPTDGVLKTSGLLPRSPGGS